MPRRGKRREGSQSPVCSETRMGTWSSHWLMETQTIPVQPVTFYTFTVKTCCTVTSIIDLTFNYGHPVTV